MQVKRQSSEQKLGSDQTPVTNSNPDLHPRMNISNKPSTVSDKALMASQNIKIKSDAKKVIRSAKQQLNSAGAIKYAIHQNNFYEMNTDQSRVETGLIAVSHPRMFYATNFFVNQTDAGSSSGQGNSLMHRGKMLVCTLSFC